MAQAFATSASPQAEKQEAKQFFDAFLGIAQLQLRNIANAKDMTAAAQELDDAYTAAMASAGALIGLLYATPQVSASALIDCYMRHRRPVPTL